MTLEAYVEKMKKEYADFHTTAHFLEVKAVGEFELEVLGAPFGGHLNGRDEHGEFFSKNTDFMLNIGDTRPVIYYHGMTNRNTPTLKPEQIGKAVVSKIDEKGVWFRVTLDRASEKARSIWEAARAGMARASSGAVGHLVRLVKKTGEILSWPIGELSLWDWNGQPENRPANELAVVRLPMRALFENAEIELPESFLESGELKKELVQEDDGDIQKKKIKVIRIRK